MSFKVVERHFSDNSLLPSVMITNISGTSSVEKNLGKMETIIEIAHRKSVNILIFPELSVTGYIGNSNNLNAVGDLLAEGENSRIEPWLKNVISSLSNRPGCLEYIFYSNVREKEKRYYNCTFILSPDFDYRLEDYIYTKVFLTPAERKFFSQGMNKRLVIDTRWGRFGFLICYDLCFTELSRQYAFTERVDALVTMAAWRSQAIREYEKMNVRTDRYYGYLWDLMNASNAAYNQIWSLGSNWVGRHAKGLDNYWGGSGVWAPSGMNLLQASNINEELLIIHNIDIKGQSAMERDDFNYKIDFEQFYRQIEHPSDN